MIKKYALFLICILLFSTRIYAQSWKKAEKLFNERKYYEAANSYSSFLEKGSKDIPDSTRGLAYFKIARCYQEMGSYDKAHKTFDRAFAEQCKEPELYYYVGELYRTRGNYTVAANYYDQFLKLGGNKFLYGDAMLKCTFATQFSNPLIGAGLKSQPDLNTQGNIRALCFLKDRLLYTTTVFPFDWSENTLEKAEGETLVFIAEIKNGLLTNPKIVPELNGAVKNIQSLSIDDATGVVYFTAKSSSGKYTLYTTSYTEGKWSASHKVDLPLFINITVEEVAIAKQGTRLFFSGVSDDGFGGKDLWYTDYKAGVWSSPVNLGRKINTGRDEAYPFIWQDQTLFFASSGMPENYGSFDLYAAAIKEDNFASAINLHKPFNSSFNDVGLVINQSGAFSALFSDRSADNKRQVYTSKLLPWGVSFYGVLQNKNTNIPISNASIKVFCGEEQIAEFLSDTTGYYNFALQWAPEKEYHAKISKPSYFSNSFSLNELLENARITQSYRQETLQQDAVMEELVLGKSYEFEEVFPPFYTTELFEKGKNELSRIADFAKDNYWAKILLFSYCTLTDDDNFNRLISNARMDTITQYLVEQGIEKNRLVVKTFLSAKHEQGTPEEHVYSLNFRLLKDNTDTIVPKKYEKDFSGKIEELYQKGMIAAPKMEKENVPETEQIKDTLVSIITDSVTDFNPVDSAKFAEEEDALLQKLNLSPQTIYYVELYPSQQRQGNRRLLQKIASVAPDIIAFSETWKDGYTHLFIGRFTTVAEAQQLVERMKNFEIYSFIRTAKTDDIIDAEK